jgi:hypothetical protein
MSATNRRDRLRSVADGAAATPCVRNGHVAVAPTGTDPRERAARKRSCPALLEFPLQTPPGTRVEAPFYRDQDEFNPPHLADAEVTANLTPVPCGDGTPTRVAKFGPCLQACGSRCPPSAGRSCGFRWMCKGGVVKIAAWQMPIGATAASEAPAALSVQPPPLREGRCVGIVWSRGGGRRSCRLLP